MPTGNKKTVAIIVVNMHTLYHWHDMFHLPLVIGAGDGIFIG